MDSRLSLAGAAADQCDGGPEERGEAPVEAERRPVLDDVLQLQHELDGPLRREREYVRYVWNILVCAK